MGIIEMERPTAAESRTRFSKEDAVQAAEVILTPGKAAGDGAVYESRKNCQQAAWELRHAIAEHVDDISTDQLTSRTNEVEVEDPETGATVTRYTFGVYLKG